MEIGALNTISAFSLVFEGINNGVENSKLDNVFTRLVNVLRIDFYLGFSPATAFMHEFVGHGGRAREFDFEVYGYSYRFPKFGGSISIEPLTYGIEPEKRMLFNAGGLEAGQMVSYETNKIFYSDRRIPYYIWFFSLMWLDGFMNVIGSQTKDPRKYPEDFVHGGDTAKYLLSLTENYGYYDGLIPPGSFFPHTGIDAKIYVNGFFTDAYVRALKAVRLRALNPSVATGLIGVYRYVARGEKEFEPFMFRIGDLKFMPGIRANLGTVGPENYFDLFMVYGMVSIQYLVSVRW
jgi:hypothetical protein